MNMVDGSTQAVDDRIDALLRGLPWRVEQRTQHHIELRRSFGGGNPLFAKVFSRLLVAFVLHGFLVALGLPPVVFPLALLHTVVTLWNLRRVSWTRLELRPGRMLRDGTRVDLPQEALSIRPFSTLTNAEAYAVVAGGTLLGTDSRHEAQLLIELLDLHRAPANGVPTDLEHLREAL